MIERYGKEINMRRIRSLDDEKRRNEIAKEAAKTYFESSVSRYGSTCRVCGNKNTSLYFEAFGGYQYYECHHCGSLFLNNLPQVEKMYRKDETSNSKLYIDNVAFEERVKQLQEPKVDFVLDVCRKNKIMSTTWVDVGAGGDNWLPQFKEEILKHMV